MTTALNGTIPVAPVNGMPMSLADQVADEARAARAIGTPAARLIADALDRLSQLVRFTGATTPEEHESRMLIWDDAIREREFQRGYDEGYEAARREFGPRPWN